MANTRKTTKARVELEKEKAKIAKERTKQVKAKAEAIKAQFEAEAKKAEAKTATARRNKPSERPRAFFVRTYIDYDFIVKAVRSAHWIQHYALIKHDRDVWTADDEKVNSEHKEGSLKTEHTHITLYTYNGKTASSVKRLFDKWAVESDVSNPQSSYIEVTTSMPATYDYLTHEDNPEKYHYSADSIVQDDDNYWSKHQKTDGLVGENKSYQMVCDVLAGVSERDLVLRYGRDYQFHANYVRQSADRIRYEEDNEEITEAMVKIALDSSPFYEIEIEKFWEIMSYLKETFANDWQSPFKNYFKKELKL